MYDKWGRDPVMFALVKAAVINACTAKKACADDILLLTRIPRTTMRRHNAAFQEAAKLHIIPLSEVTCRMIFPKAKYAPLLTADDCKFLADIVAVSWDLRNNGMTRAEIITNSDGIETMCLKTASHKPIWLPCTQLQAIWIDHFLSDMIKWWCCSGNKIKPSAIAIYSGAFLVLM